MTHRRNVPSRRAVRMAACAVLVAGVLAGCSNTSSAINRVPHTGATTAAVSNGVQQVRVVADDHDRFIPSTITVHPGQVRVTLVHTGTGAPHNFSVLGFPLDAVPLIDGGQSASTTFTAPAPGTYTFVCTIHTKQGMIGTLIVLPS